MWHTAKGLGKSKMATSVSDELKDSYDALVLATFVVATRRSLSASLVTMLLCYFVYDTYIAKYNIHS